MQIYIDTLSTTLHTNNYKKITNNEISFLC